MALKIRLRRMGRKKAPHYRIVVAESSMPRDGRFVANIGHYNPRTDPLTLVVDRDKALAWISKGATPTDTVQSLFRKAGVYQPVSAMDTAVEAVKTAATKTTRAAKGAASKAAEKVGDAVEAVTEAAQDAVETVTEAAQDAVDAVRGGDEAEAEAETKE